MVGQSSPRSASDITRARIGTAGRPASATLTSASASMLRNHAGWWSSPPREATTTSASPICSGDVSIVDRGWPDLRPVVVSSSAGVLPKLHPSRPKETAMSARCTAFMATRVILLGMMHEGGIVLDLDSEQKARMTVKGLLAEFEKVKGAELDDSLLQ